MRDATGRGVLTSLTRISEVKGYTVDGQDTIPCPGVLYYRGYDVRDLVQGALADKRFGFEEVFYLLREDKRFTDLEAWATRFTPCRTPRAEVLQGFVERLAAEKSFGEALVAYQTVEQEGKALLEARTGHFFPSILRKKRLSAQRGIDNRGGRGYHGSTWHRNKK